MRSINGMAERLRSELGQPGAVEVPGCYDVFSAMLLENAGFEAIFLGVYRLAPGNPDVALATLGETVSLARNIANRVHVPLIVETEHEHGNGDQVLRTISELEAAGAAAVILGHTEGKTSIPLLQDIKRLEMALACRQTPLCVMARSRPGSVDENIDCAEAFASAGADGTLIDGLHSLDNARRVAERVPGPKLINLIYGGTTPLLPAAELSEMGFKVLLYSTPALDVAVRSLMQPGDIEHGAPAPQPRAR
jgi:2-methylisocitrate lyase-like PEP mutase family enzyme